ncbi:hypothetical protein ASPNIDRAFT_39791 [Aspergillus niger ATCC 1015]|uniref:Uncharacterized protein n=1 Tax=Aspergillus niger (strain ATCC 1015 / CBS 113.46 / FGSC A1144 / LSHB Ac4 / NCTC 3858a / NRRL 328 / USDA 3528.7) TaxID=380704 RepID=G3XZ69_ASPNA|nr:hypothetical protein ASPNIDRAFT_39791 [Aspergillus niger ATCC 1015]
MYGFFPFSPLMRGCREGCPLDPAGSDMIGPVLILPATCVQPKPRVPERKVPFAPDFHTGLPFGVREGFGPMERPSDRRVIEAPPTFFPFMNEDEDKTGPSSGSRANTSNDLLWTGRGSDQEQEDVGQCRVYRMRARLSPRRFRPSKWPLRSSLSSFPLYLGSSSMVQCPHEEMWLWVGAAMAGCSPETMGSFSPVFHL